MLQILRNVAIAFAFVVTLANAYPQVLLDNMTEKYELSQVIQANSGLSSQEVDMLFSLNTNSELNITASGVVASEKELTITPKTDTHACGMCIRLGSKNYLIDSMFKLNFDEAEHYCKRHRGYLINILDSVEMALISNYLAAHSGMDKNLFWIGGKTTNPRTEFRSVKTMQRYPYFNWAAGQPHDGFGEAQHCMAIKPNENNYDMIVIDCDEKAYFICETEQ